MPTTAAAASAQQTPPPSRFHGDLEREHSGDESWSAVDSDNDRVAQNGSSIPRALKRKRPLTVSYVPVPPPSVDVRRARILFIHIPLARS